MIERIKMLCDMTLRGDMYPKSTTPVFDRMDLLLPEHTMQAKRIHDYILAQEPVLTEYQSMTGSFTYNGSVVGDAHGRSGHKKTAEVMNAFYLKPLLNLSTMEWQHATADFNRVIRLGVKGLRTEIAVSMQKHKDNTEKTEFLKALLTVVDTLVEWAHKCSEAALRMADKTENPKYKANLIKLSQALLNVPENPAGSFYEAVLSLYIFFQYDPDSLGTLDRTLYDYYKADIESGALTKDEAKTYLQELFLMIQARTPKGGNFTRGGESHFCVGGYDREHNDVFNDFSMLILEAMTDLPTYIPQASLRWTKKSEFEDFLRVLKLWKSDRNNRIAFVSDEIKIHSFMHIAKMPFEVACRYSSVGCNEVAFPGGMVGGTTNTNVLRSVEKTFFERTDDVLKAETFEEFFNIYREELCGDIDLMLYYDDEFNRIRAKDTNYISSVIFADCIDTATSFTAGKVKNAISGPGLIGIVNVIDSLSVVKQFVYDMKLFKMSELVEALKNDWVGFEDMRTLILKKADFFGNDGETSNYVAALFTDTLYEYTKEKRSIFGYPLIFGNLEGYNPHHKWFGSKTAATPDGRKAGEMMKFGLSQTGGYDRNGLSALLNSVAACDKHGIITGGSSVTNISLDKKLIVDDNGFINTAKLLETYFKNGGSQFQLNCVSAEELIEAKAVPEEHKSLRVRVSGFSDFFVNLSEGMQDDLIKRTVIEG